VFTFLGLNKALISTFKYIYQAMLNYDRKSTEGFSIENVILDFTGGLLSGIVVIIKKYSKSSNISSF
jgi:cystinosin